jgi:hypothetical protein
MELRRRSGAPAAHAGTRVLARTLDLTKRKTALEAERDSL